MRRSALLAKSIVACDPLAMNQAEPNSRDAMLRFARRPQGPGDHYVIRAVCITVNSLTRPPLHDLSVSDEYWKTGPIT